MTHAITFVVPAFNAAATLTDTLRSILAQSRPDWFTLVIDDGSTDATAEVAASFHDARIRVVHQKNSGVAVARNRGLAMSTSPAVAFIDADDTIDPDYMDVMLPALERFDLVPAAYRYTGPLLEDAGWLVTPAASDVERLCEFNQFAIGAIAFSREALGRLASPSPFPTTSHQEDWELLLNLRSARWAPIVQRAVYSYRLRPESRTTALTDVWRDGLNLIARSIVDPPSRELALRRWSLRCLARGASAGGFSFCRQLFEHLDPLTQLDADTLTGALRWSLRRAAVAREPLSLAPRETWHFQVLSCMGTSDLVRDCLRRAITPDWAQVAAAAAARVRPDQTLVIYGVGRNGREVLDALSDSPIPLAIIDDSAAAIPNVPRVKLGDLGPRHIVLVTPDDRTSILAKLGQSHPAQILLPEQLVA